MSSDFKKKVFLRSKKLNNLYIGMAIIGTAGFLVMIMIGGPGGTMLIPAVLGIIMLSTKNKPLLQFHEDYFEYKPAPLTALFLVRYENIENVDKQKNFIELRIKNHPKPFRIILNVFNQNEHNDILNCLTSGLNK